MKFDYFLPQELIANEPANPRDSSRLLSVKKETGELEHLIFNQLPSLLKKGDVLVFNQTKVLPARLLGKKVTGGKVELLLLEQLNTDTWTCIGKPGLKMNNEIIFDSNFSAKVIGNRKGELEVKFNLADKKLMDYIHKIGLMPLPPYIKNSDNQTKLRQKYQTVYAKDLGSAAAPTAGFHFTNKLIKQIKEKGVQLEYVTLHVGLGTFKSPSEDNFKTGKLHQERYFLDEEPAKRLNLAKKESRRIIAVGTTTTRVLESCVRNNLLQAGSGRTDIFIYPPYKFKFTDCLITNFHLPGSSLLMLISAFISQPNTKNKFTDFKNSLAGEIYAQAIAQKYRFYSFGDATFIH